jgi:hypothetical protein
VGLSEFVSEGFYLERVWTIAVWWFLGWPLLLILPVGLWFWPGAEEVRRDWALTLVPLAWLVGAMAVYIAGAKEITANPWNLHMFHVPLAFILGRGLVVLLMLAPGGRTWGGGASRGAALLVIVLLWSVWPTLHSIKRDRSAWDRVMGERLAELRDPDDLAILVGTEVGDPVALYYSRGAAGSSRRAVTT